MRWAPQGLERIGIWKQRIGQVPLVAIGGLTPERGTAALVAGADSVAVVTDVLLNADPEARCREWLDVTRQPA
jgi:thiamine-phosphate pyrophosphorylase